MELGAFSISLSVADLERARQFYEALGFEEIGGSDAENYLILKNGECVIGLFQGMFEGNVLTFNPGWDQAGEDIDPFADVREIQAQVKQAGITPLDEVDESGRGPGSLLLQDPDGNILLIDQHR